MKKYSFYITLFGIVLVGSTLLVPKIATRLFSFKRSALLNELILKSKKNNTIDGRQFWMVREYYSPGSFTFKKTGFTNKEINPYLKDLDITLDSQTFFFPFLMFHSEKLESVEALTQITKIKQILSFSTLGRSKNCIIEQPSTYMCYKDSHTIMIIFVKPMNEMMTTNGFYDYKTDEVKKLTKDKYWLVVSKVTF